ncbi:cupin domain-containing protein [Bacillus vallismortis]|uniref:cupin domain-containing protein n=1 Tax=Bacillus vallismortis TaxID=72361 RepID=UPI002282DC8E|nr:cupin domain-containing protein [Bacillus vallismortis]MCY7919871.1 cupin domain-containing protein [Bacillus vallismortis]MCY8308047.1 cupin domain-containing protein [Bacillus vallismortis]MCY8533263.1 cupin domain-containing protein [Bacillus vallismortis]MCY8596781.1 cupin domain-containing protein [Bacillus vallismortis]
MEPETQTYFFQDDGRIPNHPDFPLVVYQNALKDTGQAERIVNRHGWSNSWSGSVFPYHHYHSNAHEVLIAVQGEAVIQFGGEKGVAIPFKSGDAVVIPAGVGHKKQSASGDFTVIGAYPGGVQYDMKMGEPSERKEAMKQIKQVALPANDPITGKRAPLLEIWVK